MQNYIIETNKIIKTLKIPALYKFAINAIFLEDLNIEKLLFVYSDSQEKSQEINLKDKKLYWNELNKSEFFWINIDDGKNNFLLESNLNIYVNIIFIPINFDIDNIEPLNFNEERFLIVNRLFCNQLSIEDCPYDFFQCYNHQKNKNINFCSLYEKTNNKEITEIEKKNRKNKHILDNNYKILLAELEKNKQIYSKECLNNNKKIFFIIIILLIIQCIN